MLGALVLDLVNLDHKEASRYGMNHFIVTGRHKVKDKWLHARRAVVCRTIHQAIKAFEDHFSECEILSIAHQGSIDYLEVI